MTLVYCVEDDVNIRELMIYALESQQFEVRGLSSGEELSDALADRVPEVILLDVMLPGEDGLSILKRLRAQREYDEVRIILVTAKSAEYDVITGLDLGADDYISKPFGIMEMIARVRAALRRGRRREEGDEIYRYATIVLDRRRHRVSVAGEPIRLTAKEFDLLAYLLLNVDIVLSREQMMERVWDVAYFVESRTVDMHIMSLRQKLGDAGKYIHTVRGVGYKLGEVV